MPLISFDPDKAATPVEELLKRGPGQHMIEQQGNSKFYIHVSEDGDFEFSVEEDGKTVPSTTYYISLQKSEHGARNRSTHSIDRKKAPTPPKQPVYCYYCIAGPGGMICTPTPCK